MLWNANIEVVQAIYIRVPGEPGNEASFCILQAIKNRSQGRPGNEAIIIHVARKESQKQSHSL